MNTIHDDVAIKVSYFNALGDFAINDNNLKRLHRIWKSEEYIPGVNLSENERISLSAQLAIKMPKEAEAIIAEQLAQIENPDSKRRYKFRKDIPGPNEEIREARFYFPKILLTEK